MVKIQEYMKQDYDLIDRMQKYTTQIRHMNVDYQ